ncbi:MAG: hypothetical protein J6P65_03410 [Bacteroidales bacterium]|nr:hypothetical protein [Bacteroidales bacterium]
MKDTAIEEMFARYQPDLGDNEKYMEALSKKLEAVEYVKKYREEQVRHYRKMMVVVFAMGIITGAIGLIFAMLYPVWSISAINIPVLPSHQPVQLPNISFLLVLCFAGLSVTSLVAQWMNLKLKKSL